MRTIMFRVLAIVCLTCSSFFAYAGNLGKLGIGYIFSSDGKTPVHFTLYRYLLDHPMVIGGDTLQTVLSPHPATAEFFLTGEINSSGVIRLWNNANVVKEFQLGTSHLRSEQELESFYNSLYQYLNPATKKPEAKGLNGILSAVGKKNDGNNSGINRIYAPGTFAAYLYSSEASTKTPSAALPGSTILSFWPVYKAKSEQGFFTQFLTDPLGSNEDRNLHLALEGQLKLEKAFRLGISGTSVAAETNKQKKTVRPAGVKVTTIEQRSNANKDGVRLDDIITTINNTAVTSIQDMQKLVGNVGEGRLTIKLYRAGKPLTVQTATYQGYQWVEANDEAFHTKVNLEHDYASELSFDVKDFDKKYAEKKGWKVTTGVRISGFNNRAISRKTVLETDDILVSMNGQPIQSSSEFSTFVEQQLAGQVVKLELIRKGQKIWVEDVIVPKERQIQVSEGSPFAGMSALAQARINQGYDDPSLFNSLFTGSTKKEVVQYATALLIMNSGSHYLSRNYFKILDAGMLSSSHKDALTNLLDRSRWESYTLNTIAAARLLQLAEEPGGAIMAYQQALQQLKDVHSTPRRTAVMQYYILNQLNTIAGQYQLEKLEQSVLPSLVLSGHLLSNKELFHGDTAYWQRINYIGQVSDMAQSKLKEEKKQKFKNTVGALALTAGTVASYSKLGTEVGDEMLQQTVTKLSVNEENMNALSSQRSATFSAVQINESFKAMYTRAQNSTGTSLAGEFLHQAYSLNNPAALKQLLSSRSIQQMYPESKALLSKLTSASTMEEVLMEFSGLILAREQQLFINELSKL